MAIKFEKVSRKVQFFKTLLLDIEKSLFKKKGIVNSLEIRRDERQQRESSDKFFST